MADEEDVIECVHFVPKEFRPGDKFNSDEEDDEVWVDSVGDPFMYVIPSFDVLAVELRLIRISGYSRIDGEEKHFDLFIKNHGSLCRPYPSLMTIKDYTLIEVSIAIKFNTALQTLYRTKNFKLLLTHQA